MTDPSSSGKHPIRVVAQRTGLKTDLIRAWERRYGAIKPQRSEGRHRFYSDGDVERLILLRDASSSSRSIGQLAGLSDDALRRLIEEDRRAAAAAPERPVPAPSRAAADAALRSASSGDLQALALDAAARLDSSTLAQALDQGSLQLGFSRTLTELVEPLLESVADMRRERRLRPVHERFVDAEIRAFVHATLRRTTDPEAPRAVVTAPPGRHGETRALLIAAHATAEGWQCVYLGPDLPADEIVAAARACRAPLVLLDLSAELDAAPSAADIDDEIERLRRGLGAGRSVGIFDPGSASATRRLAPAGDATAAALWTVRDVAGLKDRLSRLRTRPVRSGPPSLVVERYGAGRELPVTAAARRRYRLDASLFSRHGGLRIGSLRSVRRLVHQLGTAEPRAAEGPIFAGELQAAALLHELAGRDSLLYAQRRGDGFFESLWTRIAREVDGVHRLLEGFQTRFPPNRLGTPPTEGRLEIPQWELLRRLLLTRLLCLNPACVGVRRLFDDGLDASTLYGAVEAVVRRTDSELLDALAAGVRAHPSSLEGQLQFQLDSHPDLPEDLADRLWLCLDVLHEERAPTREQLDESTTAGTLQAPAPGAPAPHSTTREAATRRPLPSWARDVVLQVKILPIWLAELSRRYGRRIDTLDRIPDAALEDLAARGVNALWLVGLWRRGAASARIKHAAGKTEAISSAYAVDTYDVDPALGGDAAKQDLERRAGRAGLRLACDMVPNHTALDSRWVIEHPERFIQVAEPPYPSYSFTGPDLSDDPRVSIFLEDHYRDRSDAAVVFRRLDRRSGHESFLYHGNDGTALPWNDTAQLDYTREDVRRLLADQIVRLAKEFPILRLDAAMTLIRDHFQRLWFPEPGKGGAVPSRAEFQTSRERFRELLPDEIWRRVLDQVAEQAPDSLLIAEAFWLTESYFSDQLGMDRVYDSAFLEHLREGRTDRVVEELRTSLRTKPENLEGRVRFLTNPDLPPAAELFGTEARYLAACTLLVTLPGLPLWGHGQWEGRREAFAMDAAAPLLDEGPNDDVAATHRRVIAPLLKERALYSRALSLRLFETVEPVLAFVNGTDDARRLVMVNFGPQPRVAHLHLCSPFLADAALRTATLAAALALPDGLSRWVDPRLDVSFLLDKTAVEESGWSVDLEPWQALVLSPAP